MYVIPQRAGRGGLGLLPAMAIPSFLTSLNTALSSFGLNSSDPARDRIRLANIAQAFSLAVVSDPTPQFNLDNLSGEAYLHQIADDRPVAGGGSAAGSAVARRAAQAAIVELGARRAATGIVGTLLPVSTIPATVGATIGNIASSPLFLGALALGAYLLIARRKGR